MPAAFTDADADADRIAYRRSFFVVALVHGIVVLGIVAASLLKPPKEKAEEITWLSGGEWGGGELIAAAELPPPPEPEPEPIPEPPAAARPEPPPPPPPAKSELVLAKATPKPAAPKPSTPKPTPKPKPATPKPAPEKKATPKPAPKKTTPKPEPQKKEKPKDREKEREKPKSTPKPAPKKAGAPPKGDSDSDETAKKKAAALAAGVGKSGATKTGGGSGADKAGKGPGAGRPSDFGDYFSILRDRFYAVWTQPTSIARSDGDLTTTLRIKVKRDGTVLGYEIVKSSGNSLMDGSVLAAAQQTTKIDPLPDGLGSGEEVEIPINFKLDQAP